jgi:hypothetical protein
VTFPFWSWEHVTYSTNSPDTLFLVTRIYCYSLDFAAQNGANVLLSTWNMSSLKLDVLSIKYTLQFEGLVWKK